MRRVGSEYFHWIGPSCSVMRSTQANNPNGYLLGSYRIATAPEPNSSRLTSLKSTCFDSPANNVGPWPASLGCTTNSYSSINSSSANASGSFTPPKYVVSSTLDRVDWNAELVRGDLGKVVQQLKRESGRNVICEERVVGPVQG